MARLAVIALFPLVVSTVHFICFFSSVWNQVFSDGKPLFLSFQVLVRISTAKVIQALRVAKRKGNWVSELFQSKQNDVLFANEAAILVGKSLSPASEDRSNEPYDGDGQRRKDGIMNPANGGQPLDHILWQSLRGELRGMGKLASCENTASNG